MAPDLGTLLCIIFSASFALGDHFVNPPDLTSQTASPNSYPVFAVGDILDVSWVTSADVVDLVINQLNSPVTEIDRTPNSASLRTGAYTWKITTDGSDGGAKFDLTFSNVFNFMTFKVNSTTISAQSAFFNISNTTVNQHGQRIATLTSTSPTLLPTSSSTSSSLSSSASSSTSSLLSTRSALSTTSTLPISSISSNSALITTTTATFLPNTSTSPVSASSSKGLSMGASVGLGVGIGIFGVAAIAGALIWWLFQRRKRNPAALPPYSCEGKPELAVSDPKVYPSELDLAVPQKGFPTELPS